METGGMLQQPQILLPGQHPAAGGVDGLLGQGAAFQRLQDLGDLGAVVGGCLLYTSRQTGDVIGQRPGEIAGFVDIYLQRRTPAHAAAVPQPGRKGRFPIVVQVGDYHPTGAALEDQQLLQGAVTPDAVKRSQIRRPGRGLLLPCLLYTSPSGEVRGTDTVAVSGSWVQSPRERIRTLISWSSWPFIRSGNVTGRLYQIEMCIRDRPRGRPRSAPGR